MSLIENMEEFREDVTKAVEMLEEVRQSTEKLAKCTISNLGKEVDDIQHLFAQISIEIRRADDRLIEINCKWGSQSISLKSPRLIPGNSGELAKNLISKGISRPSGCQAHHLIPSAIANKSELMLNAIEKAGFDIDCAENGIFLPTSFLGDDLLPTHRGSHPRYSNYAEDVLELKWDELKASGSQNEKAALISAINDTISYLKEVIKTQGEFLRFTINDL